MFTPRWCLLTESMLVNVFAEETFPALANFRQIFVVSHFQNCKPKYLSQKKDSRSPLAGQKHTTQPLSPPAWQAPSSSADKESFRGVLGTTDKIPACLQADQNPKGRKDKIHEAINSWQLFAHCAYHIWWNEEVHTRPDTAPQRLSGMGFIHFCFCGKKQQQCSLRLCFCSLCALRRRVTWMVAIRPQLDRKILCQWKVTHSCRNACTNQRRRK